MESQALEVLSRAQIFEKIKDKIRNHDHVLWPTVSEKIQELKTAKRAAANRNPNQEYRTVFHLDLTTVLLDGSIVDSGPAVEPQPGSVATVKGADRNGFPLTVFVHLCLEDGEPLQITGFCITKE
jgi:hypothetical protein